MTERALLAAPRERLSDRALALAIGAVLFVISAWPLLLVELPPLQDLPNHLASAYIADHLDRYPEYVFNGFWKSNSLLELWLHVLSDHLCFAGRTFAALTLAVNALVLPWFLLHFAGRRTMVTAALLVWPLVHGFTFAMGMLNFALAMPLSLIVLVLLDRQRQAPRLPRSLAITGLSVVAWLAHPFPLVLVGLLCAVESAIQRDWRARVRVGVATLLPLAPIGLLIVGTALHHMVKAAGAPPAASHGFELLTLWELPAHFWLDASGALTRWGSTTAIPAIALPVLAWRHRHERRPMFGSVATIALIVGYLGLPLMISNWWYLNTRIAPLLWLAFAVRVPPVLPRRLVAVLAASALVFSLALGIDYVRLDRDRAELTAGIAAVPEGATLLPLLFQHRKTSDYIASLTHAWGFYVLAKQTTAPLAFAVERSYPITYRVFPPAPLIPPALDRFAVQWATPELACAADGGNLGRSLEDCTALWRLTWAQFWRVAEPRFNFVLAWAMPPVTRAIIPASYQRVLAAGDLEIYAHIAVSAER